MGIELLQEASNVAALQQMYRTMGSPWTPGHLPPHPGLAPPGLPVSVSPMLSSLSSLDLYYRQAAAAHSLQRPFPYKLGSPPSVPGTPLPPSAPGPLLPLPQLGPGPLAPLSLPTASSILQEMSTDAMRSVSPPPAHSPVPLALTRPASVSPPRLSPSCVEPAPASRRISQE